VHLGRHRARYLAGYSLTPAVLRRGDLSVCVHAGGSTKCGAPGGAAVKTSLGRAWSAARALPRHANQVCSGASGKCDPSLLSSPSFPGHAL
jgi:hypothetical protein